MRAETIHYDRLMAGTIRQPDGCLISPNRLTSIGYTQIFNGDAVVLGHRLVWTYVNGPIPDGMTVDHVCHVRNCLEITHLRLLTNVDNATDNGQVVTRVPIDRRCGRGHKMVLSLTTGRAGCRECNAAWKRENRRRNGNHPRNPASY